MVGCDKEIEKKYKFIEMIQLAGKENFKKNSKIFDRY